MWRFSTICVVRWLPKLEYDVNTCFTSHNYYVADFAVIVNTLKLYFHSNLWVYISVQFSQLVMSDSLQPDGLQHARLPCPSPTPRACSNLCPWSWWCHPTIWSSVIPFSSFLQSFPASGAFPMSQYFTSGGQSIGATASESVIPMDIQDWFPLGLTGLIIWQYKVLSRVFNTTVQKQQFFSSQFSL